MRTGVPVVMIVGMTANLIAGTTGGAAIGIVADAMTAGRGGTEAEAVAEAKAAVEAEARKVATGADRAAARRARAEREVEVGEQIKMVRNRSGKEEQGLMRHLSLRLNSNMRTAHQPRMHPYLPHLGDHHLVMVHLFLHRLRLHLKTGRPGIRRQQHLQTLGKPGVRQLELQMVKHGPHLLRR